MKKRFKTLTAVALLSLGGVVGYASTNVFDSLNQIRSDYDFTFNFAMNQKQKA